MLIDVDIEIIFEIYFKLSSSLLHCFQSTHRRGSERSSSYESRATSLYLESSQYTLYVISVCISNNFDLYLIHLLTANNLTRGWIRNLAKNGKYPTRGVPSNAKFPLDKTNVTGTKKKPRLNPQPNVGAARKEKKTTSSGTPPDDSKLLKRKLSNLSQAESCGSQTAPTENMKSSLEPSWISTNKFQALESLKKDSNMQIGTQYDEPLSNILHEIRQKNVKSNSSNVPVAPRQTIEKDAVPESEMDKTPAMADKSSSPEEPSSRTTPFFIWHQSTEDTIKLMRDHLKIENFYTKRINKVRHILYLQRSNDYDIVEETLVKSKTRFYTFAPKSHKKFTFLLKGLEPHLDTKRLLDSLKAWNIPNLDFISARPFSTKYSRTNKVNLPIYIIQLEAGNKTANLKKISQLNCRKVSWEKIVRKGIIQCKNCQRFGHTASSLN